MNAEPSDISPSTQSECNFMTQANVLMVVGVVIAHDDRRQAIDEL